MEVLAREAAAGGIGGAEQERQSLVDGDGRTQEIGPQILRAAGHDAIKVGVVASFESSPAKGRRRVRQLFSGLLQGALTTLAKKRADREVQPAGKISESGGPEFRSGAGEVGVVDGESPTRQSAVKATPDQSPSGKPGRRLLDDTNQGLPGKGSGLAGQTLDFENPFKLGGLEAPLGRKAGHCGQGRLFEGDGSKERKTGIQQSQEELSGQLSPEGLPAEAGEEKAVLGVLLNRRGEIPGNGAPEEVDAPDGKQILAVSAVRTRGISGETYLDPSNLAERRKTGVWGEDRETSIADAQGRGAPLFW